MRSWPTTRASRGDLAGFTLIELVIALAIISASVLTILYLQVDAVDDAGESVRDRRLQRLAQEKLDEVMFEIEEGLEGTFESDPRIRWSVAVNARSTSQAEGQIPLVECTITLTYTPDEKKDPIEYHSSSWYFPSEGSPILDLIATEDTPEGGF